jgi:hypothetical protein
MAAGCGGVLACPASAISGDRGAVQLSAEHQRAVNRRRRIVVQYDCHGQMGLDFDRWIDYRFSYADQPGTQIDALWWDLGRLGNVVYPSKLLNPFDNHEGFKRWRDQGIDMVGRLVEETKRRNLECFWHHRVSEVDLRRDGQGAAWKDAPDPLKQAHPDWTLTCWWPHGLWDFSIPDVRQLTVESLREVAGQYDFDGIQLDFARHVPCLPLGRQWELRHHVTDLVRSVRRMLLEIERKRGRPLLLAAKVPRNLKGCRVDGFDVEPANLARDGQPAAFRIRISGDLPACADRVESVLLRVVLFGASDEEVVEASLNGVSLPLLARDPDWKDAQIFSPKPQPASGGTGRYKVNPRQRLLRLDFAVEPGACRQGENRVRLHRDEQPKNSAARRVAVEKLEVHVQYL